MFELALIKEIVWYLFSGGCSTVVSQLGYSFLFRRWHLSNVWAKSLSWLAAAITAFILIRYLAFSTTQCPLWESIWKFFSTRIFTAVLTVILMWLVIDKFLGWDLRDKEKVKTTYHYWPEIINLVVTILEVLLNYFIAKFYIF